MSIQNMIKGRQVVATLTNRSGGAVAAGDVVVMSTANAESFISTTTAAYRDTQIGVVLEPIASLAAGRVLLEGYAPLVNVDASVSLGDFLFTHTVALQATGSSGYGAGAFAQVSTAGATPSAYLFPLERSSGATIHESAHAAPPASPVNGDLWLINDSWLNAYRASGAWSYHFNGRQVTKPVAADSSTWVNQGSAVLTDLGHLELYTPASASGYNVRGVVKAVPSLPYTIDALVLWGFTNYQYMGAGIGWSDGTKLSVFQQYNGALAVTNLDTPTTGFVDVATDTRAPFTYGVWRPFWMRIQEDNTNRTVSYSLDMGLHFKQLYQVARTTHLTATHVGFFLYNEDASDFTAASLLHWAES